MFPGRFKSTSIRWRSHQSVAESQVQTFRMNNRTICERLQFKEDVAIIWGSNTSLITYYTTYSLHVITILLSPCFQRAFQRLSKAITEYLRRTIRIAQSPNRQFNKCKHFVVTLWEALFSYSYQKRKTGLMQLWRKKVRCYL